MCECWDCGVRAAWLHACSTHGRLQPPWHFPLMLLAGLAPLLPTQCWKQLKCLFLLGDNEGFPNANRSRREKKWMETLTKRVSLGDFSHIRSSSKDLLT